MEKQNKQLTLGSLFDGSGGFPLGGLISGITPCGVRKLSRLLSELLPSVCQKSGTTVMCLP